jgi:hypothetical protein
MGDIQLYSETSQFRSPFELEYREFDIQNQTVRIYQKKQGATGVGAVCWDGVCQIVSS